MTPDSSALAQDLRVRRFDHGHNQDILVDYMTLRFPIVHAFEKNFGDDKSLMAYFVLCDCMAEMNFAFQFIKSDRSTERKRIGSRIREIREAKNMEARFVAKLANIDAANLSRIEQGKYSVGLDILHRISTTLGVKVDLVEQV